MNESMPTPCQEWEEKLAAFDLDDLAASEREALNSHLQSCAACASVLADYQRMDLLIDQALTNDRPLELPNDFGASRQHLVTDRPHFGELEDVHPMLREHAQREGLQVHPSGHVVVARSRLKQLLDTGTLTSTYLGEHLHLKKPVVVKVHHIRLSKKEEQRFCREAEKIVGMSHPNILPVLEFGIHEEKPILVMDHIAHNSLRERHPRGLPVPLPVIVSYVKKIADALQHAHDQNIIHRKIRPENILIASENQILLTGFDVPAIQSNVSSLRHPSTETHFYMAPEQFQGNHLAASDQYALAVMVYEWLSGERPFYGTATEIATKHREAPPPPLQKQVPELTDTVEQVVLKALAKKPEMRFKNVLEFARALEEACKHCSEESSSL